MLQSIKPNVKKYKFLGIPKNLNINQKINLKSNILNFGSPIYSTLNLKH